MNLWFKMKAQHGKERKEKKLCTTGENFKSKARVIHASYVYISLPLRTFGIYAYAVSGYAY